MNKKQYFVTGLFFLALGFYTMLVKTIYINSLFSYITWIEFKHLVDMGILFIILLSFPLFILFTVLGWLEPKKK